MRFIIFGQETPAFRQREEWPSPFFLSRLPLAGGRFWVERPNQLPSSCPSGVKFPSTKLGAGTFPRAALPRTPSGCLTTQVTERRAPVAPHPVWLQTHPD